MSNNFSEVVLTVNLRGTQTSRGSYCYSTRSENDGEKVKQVEELRVDKHPEFTKPTQIIKLGESFIMHSIATPPNLKTWNVKVWERMSHKNRVEVHAKEIVRDQFPNHLGFNIELI